MSGVSPRWLAAGVVGLVLVGGVLVARRPSGGGTAGEGDAAVASAASGRPGVETVTGLVGPLAAASVGNGDVIVAAFDGAALRVQRIDRHDAVVADQRVLGDVTPSADGELKVFAAAEGVHVLFRGLHAKKLERLLVSLEPDLRVRATAPLSSSVACATRRELWTSDGGEAVSHPFGTGAARRAPLPREDDAELLCSPAQAFAVLDADERTDVLALDDRARSTVLRDKDFGEEEQRERSEYAVDDAAGLVRLGTTGALALRETVGGKPGPLHRLKTAIGRDDDVVAVDASARAVVVVYTEDLADDAGDRTCPRPMALRVDRQTFEESTFELSPPRCGFELGPYFTSAVGEAVSIAWPERTGGIGRPRAPIVALATALVPPAGAPTTGRIGQDAEAIADAACDPDGCAAVTLARGAVKILRYATKR